MSTLRSRCSDKEIFKNLNEREAASHVVKEINALKSEKIKFNKIK